MTTKTKKRPAKPRARKRMKPWTGWAIVRKDGHLFHSTCLFSEMNRASATGMVDGWKERGCHNGERVARVEVREVPRRKKARGT